MALPTVGWAFLHQVIMKTVPPRCASKVNTTWAMPQLRLLFMWPEAVSSWQSKPEHISHTEASPDVAKRIPIPSDKEESYLWGLAAARDECWCSAGILCILFLFSLGCQSTRWYHPYERRVFSQLNLIGNSLTDLAFHYGPSCLSYDLTDSEVHHHPKQRLSYSHLQRFFFFWQCSPLES